MNENKKNVHDCGNIKEADMSGEPFQLFDMPREGLHDLFRDFDEAIAIDDVELRGLGTLEVKERKTYSARNPKTGEAVTVPSHRRVIFRPGRELKAALKHPRK